MNHMIQEYNCTKCENNCISHKTEIEIIRKQSSGIGTVEDIGKCPENALKPNNGPELQERLYDIKDR